MKKCNYCGRENDNSCKFCGGCGAELPSVSFAEGPSNSEPKQYINNPFEEDEPEKKNDPFENQDHQPTQQPKLKRMDQATHQQQNYSSPYRQTVQPKANADTTDTVCIVGLAFSISSLFCCGTTALLGLIVSIVGVICVSKNGKKGKGLAICGIVIAGIMLFLSLVVSILDLGSSFTDRLNNDKDQSDVGITYSSSIESDAYESTAVSTFTPIHTTESSHDHTVFISTKDNCYHNYDCSKVDNSYSAYTQSYAISRGLVPCPICFPD